MEKILFVDDEQSVLDAFRRELHNKFNIETAISGNDGLKKIIDSGSFAVIIADMRMPVMDGITFLIEVRKRAPLTVRMILTGNADQQTAIDAINRGAIFRFLAKPCSPENLTEAINAGLEQYRLVTAEKELLEGTLLGSINILMDILSLAYPVAFSQSMRLRKYAAQIAQKLNLFEVWQYELAAMLSSVGFINMPTETIERYLAGETLSNREKEMFANITETSGTLLANIPRLAGVAAMITQRDIADDRPLDFTSREQGEMIRIGAKLLKAITSFDIMVIQQHEPSDAIKLLARQNTLYDSVILEVLKTLDFPSKGRGLIASHVKMHELRKGMIIDTDIFSTRGQLMVAKGYEVNEMTLEHLKKLLFTQASLSKEEMDLALRLEKASNQQVMEYRVGMIVDTDIFNSRGVLIIPKGYKIKTEAVADRLNTFLSTPAILKEEVSTQDSNPQLSQQLKELLDAIPVLIPVAS